MLKSVWARLLYASSKRGLEWEHYFARKLLSSYGVRNDQRVFTHTHASELTYLLKLALECPKGNSALEVGSHLGASALFIGTGLKKQQGKLYCIDTWENQTMPDGERDTWSEFQANTAALQDTIVPLRGWSTEIDLQKIDSPISLAFIDGDHSYDAVKADFEYFEKLFSNEVRVAFHDTTSFPGVARFTGELLATNQWVMQHQVKSLMTLRRSVWK